MLRKSLVRCGSRNHVVELILTFRRGYHDGILLPGMHDFRDHVLVHFQETLSGLPRGRYRVSSSDFTRRDGFN